MTIDSTTKPVARSRDSEQVDQILRGAIEMHCHSGPSVMRRRLDHIEAIEDAAAAGVRAVLFKDHYYSVTPIVELLKKRYEHTGVELFANVLRPVIGIPQDLELETLIDHQRIAALDDEVLVIHDLCDRHRHGFEVRFSYPLEERFGIKRILADKVLHLISRFDVERLEPHVAA